LAYTYDGATRLSIYVDGQLTVTKTLPSPLTTRPTAVVIGAATAWMAGGYVYPFNGYINSVRVHGGVLAPSDVWVNYLVGPVQWQAGPVGILRQPADLAVDEPSGGTLSVLPAGAGPYSFQWYRAGSLLSGETGSSCTLTNLQWADSGAQFFCTVSPFYDCPSCATTSRIATVSVRPALPSVFWNGVVPTQGRFGFNYSTVPGGEYQIEYKDDLAASAWSVLGPAETASGTFLQTVAGSNDFTNQHRFYRVVRLR